MIDRVYIVIAEKDIIAVFGSHVGARSFIDREFTMPHENARYSIEEHEVYIM